MGTVPEGFVCIACTAILHPPIKTCPREHVFCDTCEYRIKCCPVCLKKTTIARHLILETKYDHVKLPCKYSVDGCTVQAPGVQIKTHEEFCEHSIQKCPLRAIDNCKWTGPVKEIMKHCLEYHPENAYPTYKQTLTCTDFIKNCKAIDRYYAIFQAYGELFRLMWNINYQTGHVKWRVAYIGSRDDVFRYYFEIEFLNLNKSQAPLVLKGTCQPFENGELTCSDVHLFAHYNTLRTFCHQRRLRYVVSIFTTRRDVVPILTPELDGFELDEFEPLPCRYSKICLFGK